MADVENTMMLSGADAGRGEPDDYVRISAHPRARRAVARSKALGGLIGFLIGLGSAGINLAWVGALLVGGVIAAPIAAYLVRHVAPRVLGSAVGGLIILTNLRVLFGSGWLPLDATAQRTVYLIGYAAWAAAIAYSVREHRRAGRALQTPTVEPVGP